MNLTYRKEGEYLYPNLTSEAQASHPAPMGRYGLLRKAYLKEHRPGAYNHLLMSGTLDEHLRQRNEEAHQMVEQTMEKMAAQESLPSRKENPLAWTGAMNNLRNRAEETVLRELVYSS